MIRTIGCASLPVVMLVLILPNGCSSKGASSGFINYAGELQLNPDGWYVYFNKERPVSEYKMFTISPLIIQFTPQQPKPVSMRDVDNAEKAYRESLVAALTKGGRFQQAYAPGDQVLLLRGAVTDRYQRDPKSPNTGRATMELEAIDSVTRKRVFAVIDPMLGTRKGAGEYNDPRDVFTKFANELRAEIDRAPTSPH